MEPSRVGGPASGHSRPEVEQSDGLLDSEKTGATLLFSGLFLALVGIVFTTMGWQQYADNLAFQWTQLLGPILISVGGTFLLTSICKFGPGVCRPGRESDDEAAMMEQTSTGPFMLRGANHKILHIPPAYSFRMHGGSSVNGAHADSVYCMYNAAFIAGEGHRTGNIIEANHQTR